MACIVETNLSDYEIEEAVIKDNLLRRHLTPAQKAELGLKQLDIEKKKARKRQLKGLKQFKKNTTDIALQRSNETEEKRTVQPTEGVTVKETGEAIKLVAKKLV